MERHAVTLQLRAGDIYAAQDVPYAFPNGRIRRPHRLRGVALELGPP